MISDVTDRDNVKHFPRNRNRCDLIGLSTDEKPTDVWANSLFLELDTGDFYYFTGETWAKVGG